MERDNTERVGLQSPTHQRICKIIAFVCVFCMVYSNVIYAFPGFPQTFINPPSQTNSEIVSPINADLQRALNEEYPKAKTRRSGEVSTDSVSMQGPQAMSPQQMMQNQAKNKFLLRKQREIESMRKRGVPTPRKPGVAKETTDINNQMQDNAVERMRQLRNTQENLKKVDKWASLTLRYIKGKLDKATNSHKVTWMLGGKMVGAMEVIKNKTGALQNKFTFNVKSEQKEGETLIRESDTMLFNENGLMNLLETRDNQYYEDEDEAKNARKISGELKSFYEWSQTVNPEVSKEYLDWEQLSNRKQMLGLYESLPEVFGGEKDKEGLWSERYRQGIEYWSQEQWEKDPAMAVDAQVSEFGEEGGAVWGQVDSYTEYKRSSQAPGKGGAEEEGEEYIAEELGVDDMKQAADQEGDYLIDYAIDKTERKYTKYIQKEFSEDELEEKDKFWRHAQKRPMEVASRNKYTLPVEWFEESLYLDAPSLRGTWGIVYGPEHRIKERRQMEKKAEYEMSINHTYGMDYYEQGIDQNRMSHYYEDSIVNGVKTSSEKWIKEYNEMGNITNSLQISETADSITKTQLNNAEYNRLQQMTYADKTIDEDGFTSKVEEWYTYDPFYGLMESMLQVSVTEDGEETVTYTEYTYNENGLVNGMIQLMENTYTSADGVLMRECSYERRLNYIYNDVFQLTGYDSVKGTVRGEKEMETGIIDGGIGELLATTPLSGIESDSIDMSGFEDMIVEVTRLRNMQYYSLLNPSMDYFQYTDMAPESGQLKSKEEVHRILGRYWQP